MISPHALRLFQRSSRTYFFSSLFFPASVRDDITTLYAFVRTADNYVDQIPQDAGGFVAFRAEWQRAQHHPRDPYLSETVRNFVALARRCQFDPAWVEAFLDAMESDLQFQPYDTLPELEHYMYGSADVIGYMIARILHLPDQALSSAGMLGKSMQYINFLRDIRVDLELNRVYLPRAVRRKHGLKQFSLQEIQQHPGPFKALLRAEVQRYRSWQREAAEGYHYLPWRSRIAITTAAEMYAWTADQIEADPLSTLYHVHKPSLFRVVFTGFKNAVLLSRNSQSETRVHRL